MIAALYAVAAGAMVVASMSLNAALAKSIGALESCFVNYIVGMVVAAAAFAATGSAFRPGTAPPLLAFAGGLIGVAVVWASNMLIPKMPVVYTALLVFLGQMLAGLAIDALRSGGLDLRRGFGALLVLAGMLLNAAIDAREARQARSGR